MNHGELRHRLVDILGPGGVRDDETTLREFAGDMTEAEEAIPSFVVSATTVKQIQGLLRLAGEVGLAVTPRVAGTNLGGLTIPAPGGLVLDLRAMNRILEVRETEMVAVVEPGVTFRDMRDYLDSHHPGLRVGYPLSPPEVSVMANALCAGLGNLSLRYGSTEETINGVEAVLPTGEVVRTGSMALAEIPFARAPLPDLTGLFISFQGTTGVVTKAAIELYPSYPHRFRGFILNYSLEGSYKVLRDLARLEVCDDLGGLSWPTGKMLFGVERPGPRDPKEPEFFLYMDLSGIDVLHLRHKQRVVEGVIVEARRKGFEVESPLSIVDLVRLNPAFSKFADFPTRLDFLLDHAGGGLTWVGLYGPSSRWEEASRAGERIMADHGFPPTMVSRPMKGGHFVVLRFIEIFNKADQGEVERVRSCQRALVTMALDRGFIPYKTPPWAVRELLASRLDPGFWDLLERVKGLLDPQGIMNPGKWTRG